MSSYEEVTVAMESLGGRVVSTFVFGAAGDVLPWKQQHERTCSKCGAAGHDSRRCRGIGVEPAPSKHGHARSERAATSDRGTMDAAKAALRAQADARSRERVAQRVHHCSNCGGAGHNSRSCMEPPK